MTDKPVPVRVGGKCPICAKPTEPATRPFCSKRCAELDLHRWFSGSYAIPVVEADEFSDDDPTRH
ncbi:DNA gyrase inhibitor YacG [Chthonobacter albigriseus]|uniref:DNA gyrase inhibitor YacG n=1 Tax=Chthonobacter albigriseus TaxID=1683161 RepID=UPI0015EFB37F|nr:DNA gyrase inhibitor YacG [Chthonobacter albigriseus]